jgi:DtxR family Mn-dependent transcriptional regulator
MGSTLKITPSLENYMEVIYEINRDERQVRVTDLADRLSVAKSSANHAVAQLVSLGLALHEKYGRIELTDKGLSYAAELEKRHAVLLAFFTGVLGVDEKTSDKDACIIEHFISSATMEKFTQYLVEHESDVKKIPDCGAAVPQITTLDKLRPGLRASVVRIIAKGAVKKRILDMGVTPGSELAVEKVAPMGDPIEIKVRGYALALRGAEANGIIVKILP